MQGVDFDIVPMVDRVTAQFTFCPASAPGVRFLYAKGRAAGSYDTAGDLVSLIFPAIQAGSG